MQEETLCLDTHGSCLDVWPSASGHSYPERGLFAQLPEGINQQLEYRALKEVHKADLENMANAAVSAPEKPVEMRQRDKCMEAQQLKGHWQQLVKGNRVTGLDVFRCVGFRPRLTAFSLDGLLTARGCGL